MEGSPPVPNRILSTDSSGSLNILTLEAEEKPMDTGKFMEKPLSTKDEKIVSPNANNDVTNMGPTRDVTRQAGPLDAGCDCSVVYSPNVYAPQAQAYYYGGYDNTAGDWDEYPQCVPAEGLDIASPGIYNENPSLVYHSGYGYNSQMPYGPYSPVATPLPSVRGDGQMFSPFPATYYHQPVSPSLPYQPSPISQAELSMPTGFDNQGAFFGGSSNSNGVPFGPRPGYSVPYGSFGRGNFNGNSGNHHFYDSRQGFDGFESSGPWSDWSKSSDGQRSVTTLSSSVASSQPIVTVGPFGHNAAQVADGMASLQQRPPYAYGPVTSSCTQSYLHGGMYHQGNNFGGSVSGLGATQNWIAVDKGRRRGRGNGSLCCCNGSLDVLIEQNRGPRASKPKNPSSEHNLTVDGKTGVPSHKVNYELRSWSDFATDLEDGKFFIIKSYSEDNVHKSIKYGVWASTPNGNQKLDAAYREAKEKEGACPVFLLFSVNASAQFCGVAEMTGVVDFDNSVDYWQQDKWSGQFPVKWRIIKDVPNSQFRHIILENNDNKPVTNSRDTQEVGFEQGLAILNIFKTYDSNVSILDDFDFYEERQKVMQERKARQQVIASSFSVATGNECPRPIPLSGDFIKQMTKSFAQVVQIQDSNDPVCENGGCAAGTIPSEDPTKVTKGVTPAQASLGAVGDV